MELDVDQKIKLAVEPLLARITALEEENVKIKQELTTLQTTQSKPVHKAAVYRPPVEHVERQPTAKGPRKISTDKPTDRKVTGKKEQVKGQGEQVKHDNHKNVGLKSPNVGGKVAPSPNTNKEHDLKNPKQVRPRPSTGVPNKPTNTSVHGRVGPVDRRGQKPAETEHEKKEEHKNDQKKGASHQKAQHKGPSVHGLKSPTTNKGNKTVDPKKGVAPSPHVGSAAKKGGKTPVTDPRKKQTDEKKAEIKQETKPELSKNKQPQPKVEQSETKEELKNQTTEAKQSEEIKQKPINDTEERQKDQKDIVQQELSKKREEQEQVQIPIYGQAVLQAAQALSEHEVNNETERQEGEKKEEVIPEENS